jgi:hypothetical protein
MLIQVSFREIVCYIVHKYLSQAKKTTNKKNINKKFLVSI